MTEPAKPTPMMLPINDWGMAAIEGLLATLVVLQRNGHLEMSDVAASLGNTIDHRKQNMPSRGQDLTLEHLYRMVLATERVEAKLAATKAQAAGGGNTQG